MHMKTLHKNAAALAAVTIASSALANLTTADAVAAHFGLPACVSVFNDGASVEELQQRLLDLRDQAAGIEARSRVEKRNRTAEESEEITRVFAEFEATEARLDAAQRREPADDDLAAAVDNTPRARTQPGPRAGAHATPVRNSIPVDPNRRQQQNAGAGRMGLLLNSSASSPSQIIFARERADGRAWRSSDEFFNVLANGLADPRLISAASNVEGIGTDGGFVVPASWYFGLVDGTLQEAELARRCRLFGTPSNSLSIPVLNTSDRSVSIAGIAANWVAEGSSGTSQKLKFRMVTAKLHKVMVLAESSNELLEDAGGAGYAVQLETAMKTATAYTLDEAILDGTGVGQPLGIHRAASTIEVAPESGQVADTLRFQNLVDMWARLHPSCQRRAIWFFSPDLLPALLTMTFPGSTNPVMLSGGFNDAATGAPGQTIFGRPCVISEIAPPAGDRGDITLVDLSQYALLMKSSARIAYDGAPGFDRDVATWRLTMRADGTPQWSTVITPRNGGNTLSWCVVLGAR
jgi:HK97 family phage major capsid protein